MFLYSERIYHFIQNIKAKVKEILSQEVKLKVLNNRFLDTHHKFSYPISIVVYNDKNSLGYFDPLFLELGFHEKLLYTDKKELEKVIRHEIAHYMTFIKHGLTSSPHGKEFQNFCEEMGWEKDISNATMLYTISTKDSSLLRKVQKLMALSASSNPHEASQALLKSQTLLLKNELTNAPSYEEEEKIVLQRLFLERKKNSKMTAIAKILETFFVHVVFHKSTKGTCLEILGLETHVKIAEYVANIYKLP